MDNTYSDGEFIDVTLTAQPVPPGTKSTRWLAQQQEKLSPPETPRADQSPEETTGTESK